MILLFFTWFVSFFGSITIMIFRYANPSMTLFIIAFLPVINTLYILFGIIHVLSKENFSLSKFKDILMFRD